MADAATRLSQFFAGISDAPASSTDTRQALHGRARQGSAPCRPCACSLTSRNWTPIDRPLVKWRANPPARRGVGRLTVVCPRASCLSFCWLRIGRQCAPDTHLDQVRTHRPRQGATASALSSFEPQKVLGTRRRSREITVREGSPRERRPSPLVIRRRGASSQQPCLEAMPG